MTVQQILFTDYDKLKIFPRWKESGAAPQKVGNNLTVWIHNFKCIYKRGAVWKSLSEPHPKWQPVKVNNNCPT